MTARSRVLETVRETVEDLYATGLMDEAELTHYRTLCSASPTPYSAGDIKALRERWHLSQPSLADYLGVSRSTISHWEQGTTHPRGPAQRLLALLDRKGPEALA